MANNRRTRTTTTKQNCNKRTVLPLPDVAYFINEKTPNIVIDALIPINESLLLSKDIEKVSEFAIRLNNGVYDVTFSAVAIPSENGESEIVLYINDVATNIVSTASSIASNKYPLSSDGVIIIGTNSTQIALVNTGSSLHVFENVNLIVKKIA